MPDNRLPDGWAAQRVSALFEILDSHRVPLNDSERAQMKGEYPYYGANGVVDHIDKWIFDEDLILVAEDGGHFEDFRNRPVAYRVSGKCWVNNHAHVLKPRDSKLANYLFHQLEHRDLSLYINGSTRSKLTQADLVRIELPVPGRHEAARIAEVLDAIDAAIEKTEAVIAATERLRAALLAELLSRGVPGWHTEWKEAPGIGTIPACWKVVKFGEVLASVVYGTNVLTSDSPEGTPVLGMKHIRDGEVTPEALARGVLPDGERDELLLRRGDILFNRTNSIDLVGKVGIVRDVDGEMSFASYLLRLRTKAECLDPWWLIAFLNHGPTQTALRRMATKGASQANINPTSLRSLTVPLPSLKEQQNICAVTESLRDRQVVEGHLLENLQASKMRVASALLSGRVRV